MLPVDLGEKLADTRWGNRISARRAVCRRRIGNDLIDGVEDNAAASPGCKTWEVRLDLITRLHVRTDRFCHVWIDPHV